LVILCFATWHAVAQVSTFTSVIAAGGTNDSVANALAIDGAGNTYVAGSFGRAHFGGKLDLGTTNLINLGESLCNNKHQTTNTKQQTPNTKHHLSSFLH